MCVCVYFKVVLCCNTDLVFSRNSDCDLIMKSAGHVANTIYIVRRKR